MMYRFIASLLGLCLICQPLRAQLPAEFEWLDAAKSLVRAYTLRLLRLGPEG